MIGCQITFTIFGIARQNKTVRRADFYCYLSHMRYYCSRDMTKKEILFPMAIFVLTLFGGAAHAQNNITEINNAIHRARQEIVALRQNNPRLIRRALRRNPQYRHLMDAKGTIDSLRAENARLINQAQTIVCRHDKFATPPNNAMIFIAYRGMADVAAIATLYEINLRQIQAYEYHMAELKYFPQSVKNHYDSIMHAEIDRRQIMIDSLLDIKSRMTR